MSTIKELETKYETEKNQAEINLRTQQRDSIMIILVVVIAMAIVVVWIYSQRQKMALRLQEQDKVLSNNKIDELLREQEIKSLRAYLNGQDEERKRIAEDLHDRLGSTLSATKLYFNAIKESGIIGVQSVEKANQLLDTAVEEVRDISHNLVSGAIAKFGLRTALMELKDTIVSTNQIKMEVFVHGLETRLDNKVEVHLYRVIQELISNVLKHAHATEITVQLTKNNHDISVTVEDNGAGFDISLGNSTNGAGLKNVESRVMSLGGTVYFDSSKNRGTTVLINIPVSA